MSQNLDKPHATATNVQAGDLEERVRDFANYRRSTRAATRLFRLSTEALVGVSGGSVGGVVFGAILHGYEIVTATQAAAITMPFFLLATMSVPMVAFRLLTRSTRELAGSAALQTLDDEERRARTQGDVPKDYFVSLYELRENVLRRELASAGEADAARSLSERDLDRADTLSPR